MVSSSVCERVLSRALSRGGTFAEIFIEDSRNFSMSLRDGRIENAALSRPYGAGVRVYDGLRSIYVYTCDVSETGLLRAADRAADREGEELLLRVRVRLRVREEGRVVQRDDDGNARQLRAGVVGGVEHVGADLADERG